MPACHAGDRRFESGRVRHPSSILRTPRCPPARTGRSSSSGSLRAVSVREPGFDPRPQHPRSGARPARTEIARPVGLIPALAAIALVLAVGIGFGAGVLGGAPAATPAIPAIVAAVPATPGRDHDWGCLRPAGPGGLRAAADEAVAEPSAVAVASPTVTGDIAIVPVTQFRPAASGPSSPTSRASPMGARRTTPSYRWSGTRTRSSRAGREAVVPWQEARHRSPPPRSYRRTSQAHRTRLGFLAGGRGGTPPSGRSRGAPGPCSASSGSGRWQAGR